MNNNCITHPAPHRRMRRTQYHNHPNFGHKHISHHSPHVPVDIREEEDVFVIDAVIPGIDSDGLKIEVLNNVLTISGEFPVRDEELNYLLAQRPSGKFSRSFKLTEKVDAENIQASYKAGVLKIRLPKSEPDQPRVINIDLE